MRNRQTILVVILTLLLAASALAAIASLRIRTADAQGSSPSSASSDDSEFLQYEWPQFFGDSSFSRFSAGPAPSTPDIFWKANITGIQSYITAFDGMIFVTTTNSVVAVDRETGDVLWKTDIPLTATWPVAYKIDRDHMVVESSCLDPKTGDILWTSAIFTADTGIFSANVYSPEERMFYTKVNSTVEAWNFADPSKPPTLVWTTYVPGGGRTGQAIIYGDGKVFPGSFEAHQMALDARTGDVLWDTPTKGPMIFSGSYAQGRFLRGGTDDNTLYAFNATNGEILWAFTPETDGYFTIGSAVAYGMVYELNKDGNLYAIDIETGDLVWTYQGPGPLLFPGNPTVADGKVYATTGQAAQYGGLSSTSEFACLDAFTGHPIWKLPIEALAPRESVAVAYGRLYLIPGNVTTAVDAISGSEYTTLNELWAIGSSLPPANSSWPMWRHDPAHSSTAPAGPSNFTLAWKFTTAGAVVSSPSVSNGIVYVGSQDSYVYALGAFSGNLIWKFPTLNRIESSPAVADGRVFTGGDDGYVYSLDAYTGAMLWKTFVNGNLPYTYGSLALKSSPTVVGDTVYIGSLDGYLYALNTNNGNVEWKTKTGGPITSSPAVADGAVYFTSEEPASGALYKLSADDGAVVWKKELPYETQFTGGTEMVGSPSVAGGLVFASANLRTYYAVNASTGDTVWVFTDPVATEFIVSSPIYVDGRLFVIDKFNIAALDAATGKTIWSFFTGDELYVSPSYADGKIYVVTSQRHIYILDAQNNGTKLASVTASSSSWSSPTLSYGRLYVGNNDWNIYSYSNLVTSETPQPPPIIPTDQTTLYIYGAIAAAAAASATIIGYYGWKRFKKPAAS